MTQLRYKINKYLHSTEKNLQIPLHECEPFRNIILAIRISLNESKSERDLYRNLVTKLCCTQDLLAAYQSNSSIKKNIDYLLSILFAFESIVHIKDSETTKIFNAILELKEIPHDKMGYFNSEKIQKSLYVDKVFSQELQFIESEKRNTFETAKLIKQCLKKFNITNFSEITSLITQIFGKEFYSKVKKILEKGDLEENSVQTPFEEIDPKLNGKNYFWNKQICPPDKKEVSKPENNQQDYSFSSTWLPWRSTFMNHWRQNNFEAGLVNHEFENAPSFKR